MVPIGGADRGSPAAARRDGTVTPQTQFAKYTSRMYVCQGGTVKPQRDIGK